MAGDSARGCCHIPAVGAAISVVGSSEEDGETHCRGESGRELGEQHRLRALDLRCERASCALLRSSLSLAESWRTGRPRLAMALRRRKILVRRER